MQQPWEVIITRSRLPVIRAGMGLWTLFFLVISIGLLHGLQASVGIGEWVIGALTVVVIWFWISSCATSVSRIMVAQNVMTLVTPLSSVSYRLSDICKVRFLSIPASQFQVMWLKSKYDVAGHLYHYAAR